MEESWMLPVNPCKMLFWDERFGIYSLLPSPLSRVNYVGASLAEMNRRWARAQSCQLAFICSTAEGNNMQQYMHMNGKPDQKFFALPPSAATIFPALVSFHSCSIGRNSTGEVDCIPVAGKATSNFWFSVQSLHFPYVTEEERTKIQCSCSVQSGSCMRGHFRCLRSI